jgi:putative alpha-1,2-mannosidase
MSFSKAWLECAIWVCSILCCSIAQGPGSDLVDASKAFNAGKWVEAERLLRNYLADRPDSADAHYLLASTLFHENRPTDSLAEYSNAARLRRPEADDLMSVALDYVLAHDYKDADKWMAEAVRLTPENGNAWYAFGRILYSEEKFDGAAGAFQEALKRMPGSVKAENNLGLAYQGLYQPEKAIAAYRQAIEWQKNDRQPSEQPYINPGATPNDLQSIEGRGLIGVFDFAPLTQPLIVKVAISPVSEDSAIANMNAEVPGFDFDAVHAAATASWNHELRAIDFQAAPAMEKNLYSALYHALLAPSLSMDVAGGYRGPDNQIHYAKGFNFVSSLSLWDTYRAEQPLMTLIEPEQRTSDLINSLLASQHESPFGILPVWQFQGIETWCMIGYHAVPEIVDAFVKGIRGFDASDALNAMVASATYAPYGDLDEYMRRGYVPVDNDGEAASKTVEYAFDDWTISRMARAMRRPDVGDTFEKRASYWRNNFNVTDGFVEPRLADGGFRTPFDPARAGAESGFTEGNAWQYSWYQPQDVQGLINLLGATGNLLGSWTRCSMRRSIFDNMQTWKTLAA